MKIFTKKGYPIFLALLTFLTLLYIEPSCAFAAEQNIPPLSGSENSFDQMKARMEESVNITIGNLESSKVNLSNESTRAAADKLITDLKSIKEELSNAKTEDDLIKIRQELDTLLNAAPEELKHTPGLLPHSVGPGPDMQNTSGNFSQDFKNRPELMHNGSQPPGMSNRSQQGDFNATMNGNEVPEPRHAGLEGNNSANFTAESSNAKQADSGFLGSLFGELMSALKSLFN